MRNIMIFDTETTSLNKPFCYNVGYIIASVDTETHTARKLVSKDFVVEQVWHNAMCFASAYYADKREIYVKAMRAKKTVMSKWGRITQEMIRDIKKYDVTSAYAYNSPFDDRVFTFNCDWFKTINPFDNLPIYDIRGYAHHSLITKGFFDFCERHEKFNESGNYSTSAETIYQYITNDADFVEDHTALSDSNIELTILLTSLHRNNKLILETDYKPYRSIPRVIEKTLTIKDSNNKIVAQYPNYGYTVYRKSDTIKLK